jgi:hypothetical protein
MVLSQHLRGRREENYNNNNNNMVAVHAEFKSRTTQRRRNADH